MIARRKGAGGQHALPKMASSGSCILICWTASEYVLVLLALDACMHGTRQRVRGLRLQPLLVSLQRVDQKILPTDYTQESEKY